MVRIFILLLWYVFNVLIPAVSSTVFGFSISRKSSYNFYVFESNSSVSLAWFRWHGHDASISYNRWTVHLTMYWSTIFTDIDTFPPFCCLLSAWNWVLIERMLMRFAQFRALTFIIAFCTLLYVINCANALNLWCVPYKYFQHWKFVSRDCKFALQSSSKTEGLLGIFRILVQLNQENWTMEELTWMLIIGDAMLKVINRCRSTSAYTFTCIHTSI